MPDACWIVVWVVLQALLVTAAWLTAVLILRSLNFRPNGERRTEPRGATEEIRARQVEYNNNATYRAFEFFLKITLAILGGAAALTVQQASVPSHTVRVLICNDPTKLDRFRAFLTSQGL
jgi:hypothetical protein